jgi:hypothetical protein
VKIDIEISDTESNTKYITFGTVSAAPLHMPERILGGCFS